MSFRSPWPNAACAIRSLISCFIISTIHHRTTTTWASRTVPSIAFKINWIVTSTKLMLPIRRAPTKPYASLPSSACRSHESLFWVNWCVDSTRSYLQWTIEYLWSAPLNSTKLCFQSSGTEPTFCTSSDKVYESIRRRAVSPYHAYDSIDIGHD